MRKKNFNRKKYKKHFKLNIINKSTFLPLFLIPSKIFKILLLMLLILCFYNLYLNNNFVNTKSNLFNNKEIILESNNYKIFDEIKNSQHNQNVSLIFQEINIIKHIFIKKTEFYKTNKNKIHITYSTNNNQNYKYILMVSMYSILSNCNKNSFIIFHILCTPDYNETNIEMFKSLLNKYPKNTEMVFYNMGNHFMKYKHIGISQATFYRLLAPLFINSERLIHLDGDTLTFKDLNKMYNLDFNDNYVLGIFDIANNGIDYLGIKSQIYINAGVLLFN